MRQIVDAAILRGILDASPDALVVVDQEGRIVLFSTQAEALFGHDAGDVLGRPVEILMPERYREEHVGKRHGFVASGSARLDAPEGMTLRALGRDGTEIEVDWKLSRLEAGPEPLFVVALRAAGARQRAEAAHRLSEQSLARAQQMAHLGSWEWDLLSDEVFRSAEFYRLFGLSQREASARPWSLVELLPEEDAAALRSTVVSAVEAGHCFSLEHRIVRRDGTERVVLHRGEPVFDGKRVVRFTGTLLDITERRLAQRELEAAMRRLQTIVEECPVGISIYDAEGNRTTNTRGKEILAQVGDRQLAEYDGRTLRPDGTVLPVDETPGPRALRGERVAPMELHIRRADASVVPVKISSVPLHDAGGEVCGAVVVYDDITAEKQLERLHAEWGSVVAHDLRQPLNAINLHCQLLARARDATPGVKASAEEIRQAVRRLDHMIRDLMDISRIESHRVTLSRRPVDVVGHVRATSEPIGLAEPGRPIEVNVHGEVPLVEADSDRLAQVLENLLTNAIKYGDPGTPVVVDVERGERFVEIAVTNRGPGIAADDMPRIFERFQRTPGAQASHIKGVGLGLYIVRELVEAHGGRITATSRPGEHTTFRFTLPVAAND